MSSQFLSAETSCERVPRISKLALRAVSLGGPGATHAIPFSALAFVSYPWLAPMISPFGALRWNRNLPTLSLVISNLASSPSGSGLVGGSREQARDPHVRAKIAQIQLGSVTRRLSGAMTTVTRLSVPCSADDRKGLVSNLPGYAALRIRHRTKPV